MNVMQIDLSGYERIAFATSEAPTTRAWTELALYYRPASLGDTFVGVVVGGTRIEGHQRREQRRAAATLNGAMSLFDEESSLTTKIIMQADTWQQAHPEASAIATHVESFDGTTAKQAVDHLFPLDMSAEEVAEALGISLSTFKRGMDGDLKVSLLALMPAIDRSALKAHLAKEK